MIPSWAVSGAKVVYIKEEEFDPYAGRYPAPEIGKTYTIARAGDGAWGFSIISLSELSLTDPSDGELGFDLRCFRPLVKSKTVEEDMTVFRKIASNLPTAKELEDSVQLALERLG